MDVPAGMQQPQVSATNRSQLVPINTTHLPGQAGPSCRIEVHPGHSPSASSSSIQPVWHTSSSSADPQALLHSPSQTSPTSMTVLHPQMNPSHGHSQGTFAPRQSTLRQEMGDSRERYAAGSPGQSRVPTTFPGSSMSAQQPTSAAGPSQNVNGVPRSSTDYAQQPQYRNPAQIYNYHQQVAVARAAQTQQLPRRYSQGQPHQFPQQAHRAVPQSSSAPNIMQQRPAMRQSIAIPQSPTVIDLTQTGTSSPSTNAPRHFSATYSPPTSSSSNPAIQPRSVSATYPQSPSVPSHGTQQRYPVQAQQQPGQPYVYSQHPASHQAHMRQQTYPQTSVQTVQSTSQPSPQQSHPPQAQSSSQVQPQRPNPVPRPEVQSSVQPGQQMPSPQTHPVPQQQAQQQQTQQQQSQRNNVPSTYARAHATSVLQATGGFLEQAYRAGVLLVAREFDTLNEKMTTLTTDHARLVAENARLAELSKEAEEERVYLRQERTRLLEQLAQAQRADPESGDSKEVVKRLLDMCRVYEAAARFAKDENERLKELNAQLTRQIFAPGAAGAGDATEGDTAVVEVGAFHAPKGLVDALKEAIVQQYEEKLATEISERQKLVQRTAMLEALLRVSGSAPPTAGTAAVPSQPTAEGPINRPASTPFTLPPSLARNHTPPEEPRSLSEQPSSQRTADGAPSVHSIPTPPRSATPLDEPAAAVEPAGTAEPAVKREPAEEPRWPWAPGELIDLTNLDSPPALPPLDLGALEMQLNREMTELKDSAEGERKRGMSSAPEDEVAVRKRVRLDSRAVDEGHAERGATAPQEDRAPEVAAAAEMSRDDDMEVQPATSDPQPAIATLELPAEKPAPCELLIPSDVPKAPDPSPTSDPPPPPVDPPSNTGGSNTEGSTTGGDRPSEVPSGPSSSPPQVEQHSQPSSETAKPVPASAAAPQVTNTTTVPIKEEPSDPPLVAKALPKKRLGIRHLDLVYHTSKTEMTCRMCYKRKEDMDPQWRVQKFPLSAPWTELERHCMEVHPVGYESLISLSPATLMETRERLLALDHAGKRRGT